ncbi:MAG: hypothetical protein EU544_02650, partial [Promethearchaeota archaeon]
MSRLLDLYKRDSISDLFALTNVGKRISGNRNVLILFHNHSEVVFTDGNYIYLPEKFKQNIKVAQAFVAHESGHQGYGSFEMAFFELIDTLAEKYKFPKPFVKVIINLLEDVRVNAINKQKFPGFYENLRQFTLQLLPRMSKKINQSENVFLYINLFMEGYEGFQVKPEFTHICFSDRDWKAIEEIKNFLLDSLTPNSAIIACDQLCNILSDYFIFKKEAPPGVPRVNNNYKNNQNPKRDNFKRGVIFVENPNSHNHRNREKDASKFGMDLLRNFPEGPEPFKKSQLDKSSKNTLKGIKNLDLKPDDLKELTERVQQLESIKDEKGKDLKIEIDKREIDKEIQRVTNISQKFSRLEKPQISDTEKDGIKEEIIGDLEEISRSKKDQKKKLEREINEDLNPIKDVIEKIDKAPENLNGNNKHQILEGLKDYAQKIELKGKKQGKPESKEHKDLKKIIKKIENYHPKTTKESSHQRTKIMDKLNSFYEKKKIRVENKIQDLEEEMGELDSLVQEVKTVQNKEEIKKVSKKIERYTQRLGIKKVLGIKIG